jgi:hypothetical protein
MQSEKIAELLHQYFELGVAEGREGRNHDTEAGDAQRVLSEIEAEIAALSAAEPPVTVKALEWVEMTSAREDGPAEPTGDWEASCMLGEYSVCFDPDQNMSEAPWGVWSPNKNIGHYPGIDEAKAAAQADYEARIRSALTAQVQDVAEERYRHKKRGSIYTVTARGRLQVDGDLDNEKVVVYRGEDGQTWVRPEYEFNDGRFEPLTAAPAKQEGKP